MTPLQEAIRDERELCAQEAESVGASEVAARIRARTGLDHHLREFSYQELWTMVREMQTDMRAMKEALKRKGFNIDEILREQALSDLLGKVDI